MSRTEPSVADASDAGEAGGGRNALTTGHNPASVAFDIPVKGMSCASCAGRVEQAASGDGAADASVNLAMEQVRVAFEGGADPDALRALSERLSGAGYPAITRTHDLGIDGMTCGSCVARVETALLAVPGVVSASVNLATEQARVEVIGDLASSDRLAEAVERAGYRVRREATGEDRDSVDDIERSETPEATRDRRHMIIAAILSAPMLFGMIGEMLGVASMPPGWLQFLLATPVQFWLGWRFYAAGWHAVRAGTGNMDLLVAIGTSAGWGLSTWLLLTTPAGGHAHLYYEASAVIITFVLVGKWLEARAKRQAGEAIRALMALRPERVIVRRDGQEIETSPDRVSVGEVIVVRPGQRIPLDGEIVEGSAAVDESMLTGESVPIDRRAGDPVTGGSMNLDGYMAVRVTRVGRDTVLSQIIDLVSDAQSRKAPIQRLVDRVSAVFVPVVVVIAAVTFAVWLALTGQASTAILSAVTVLVIACPCALGLATPAAMMTGTGVAARAGILIRDMETLETGHRLDTVVFDKTGTLTEGKPRVEDWRRIAGDSDDTGILAVAGSLQDGSEHPLGQALRRYVAEKGIETRTVGDFAAVSGRGVRGTIDGETYVLGSAGFLEDEGIASESARDEASAYRDAGLAVSFLARAGERADILAAFAFADTIKPDAADAVRALGAMGIRVVMLTGDSQAAAQVIARQIGVAEVIADVLPDQKAAAVASLQEEGRVVAMVGDGINDAPALAQADVGIAMASGTDIAMSAAGITLMRGEVGLVPAAIDVARRTRSKIRQNLFWAFIYNTLGLPLAAFGVLTPVFAGAAMALSSVSVVGNALLLRRWRPNAH